jgi:hypothetical protein
MEADQRAFILHVPTETVFQIHAVGQSLLAQVVRVKDADGILMSDMNMWTEHAVPAYLNAIGFKKRARHKVPKPN